MDKHAKGGTVQDKDELIREAIARSGYPLEQRVQAVCRKLKMETRANAPMRDPVTNKARETDLYARWVEARTNELMWVRPAIGAELYIECVRSDTPLFFYEKEPEFSECGTLPTLFGFPLPFNDDPDSDGFGRLEDAAGVSWWATRPMVATQWHGFEYKENQKRRSLVTSQRHDIHTAFDKLVLRAQQATEKCAEPWQIESSFLGGWLFFLRPVLVVEGDVVSVVIDAGGQQQQLNRQHVHYIKQTIWQGRHIAWIIDVVTETGLTNYLTGLKQRMEKLERFCTENSGHIQRILGDKSAQWLSTIRPMSLLPPE